MTSSDTILHDLTALPPADQARVSEYIAFLRWRAGQALRAATREGPAPGSSTSWSTSPGPMCAPRATAPVWKSKPPKRPWAGNAGRPSGSTRRWTAKRWSSSTCRSPPACATSACASHRRPRWRKSRRPTGGVPGQGGRLAGMEPRRLSARLGTVRDPAATPGRQVMRLAFATDGMGEHQLAWAAWGEPVLVGLDAGG